MFLITWARNLLSIYALILLVDYLMQFVTGSRKPWMEALHKICEPGIRVGERVMDKFFPGRFSGKDVGSIAAVVLCFVLRIILGFFQ